MDGLTKRLVQILLGMLWLGCRDDAPKRLLAFEPRPGNAAPAAVGMDCNRTGRAGCETQLCLHTSSNPSEGRVCSAYCKTEQNCPTNWQCKTLFPGQPENGVCLPPKGFEPKALAVAVPHQPVPPRRPPQVNRRSSDGSEQTDGGAP